MGGGENATFANSSVVNSLTISGAFDRRPRFLFLCIPLVITADEVSGTFCTVSATLFVVFFFFLFRFLNIVFKSQKESVKRKVVDKH